MPLSVRLDAGQGDGSGGDRMHETRESSAMLLICVFTDKQGEQLTENMVFKYRAPK